LLASGSVTSVKNHDYTKTSTGQYEYWVDYTVTTSQIGSVVFSIIGDYLYFTYDGTTVRFIRG